MNPKRLFSYILGLSAAGAALMAVAETAPSTSPQPARVVIKNQGFLPFADAPINYRSSDLDDPIARLEKRMEHGEVKLNYQPQHGYLRSVLEELKVPVSSQALVFSKTSFQFPLITPSTPRALYYNDDVYVGQVHNAKFLEFVAFDTRQGAIFYVMDEHQSDHPRFERAAVDCVQCHVASATHGVPGVMLKSVLTKPSGYPAGGAKTYVTGQESPLSQRWGGWYVTALRGAELGLGNAMVTSAEHPEQLAKPTVANVTNLNDRLIPAGYLTGSSDIVAQLVLAHQTQMHNLITQTTYKTRLALFADEKNNSPACAISEVARQQIEAPVEQLVRYLLFADEAPLEAPVVGNTGFTEEFAARGPFDSHGRSLRQFDLKTRIFRYPCSYLIYSETFDAIPAPAKQQVYQRLFEVLSGHDQSADFKSLSANDRSNILEILVETKPGLPPQWKQFVQQAKQLASNTQSKER